ncbi:hypothetical protein GCM10010123_18800 [Pilimelia anulata]|uniref:Uncharacterized protein n=1 Tax=Pilimelia anulata TaxID=53371 RepID=A0A8J3F9U1_9ACTN|nr:lipoprotein [Pilimelia anulata]GGJ89386.1 hypothetical protein GCM10010123_18800 [Pilimelia anulata]
MNRMWGGPAAAVVATAALAGCGGDSAKVLPPAGSPTFVASGPVASPSAAAKPGKPWYDEVRPAAAGARIGAGTGTPCGLPVTFTAPKGWKAKPVKVEGELAELGKQGGFTLVCELDAKSAGLIGLVRIMRADEPATDLTGAADAYLAPEKANVRGRADRPVTVDGVPALEVTWGEHVEALGETMPRRALLVTAAERPVLMQIGGLDEDLHKDLLAGLVLARGTMGGR